MGRGRAQRHNQQSRVEDQAELVHGVDRGSDDSAAAQRIMAKRAGATVVEEKGSHAIYVSQPKAVAALIEVAIKAVAAGAV